MSFSNSSFTEETVYLSLDLRDDVRATQLGQLIHTLGELYLVVLVL